MVETDKSGESFLTVADVVALHFIIMERTGATGQPLRDSGALESAVMRPRMASHYEGADIVRQATLLGVGISQAQAFLDGNKRTAYAGCDVFLRLNAMQYAGEPLDLARQLELIAMREDTLVDATRRFEEWLRRNVAST